MSELTSSAGGSLTVLRSGSASDVGRVRTVNEDLALESLTLFAVADGMGGHVGGEIAARTAIDTLQAEFARKPSADGLAAAIHEANRAVWERGHADADLRGMGTTMIAAALVATDEGDRLVLANVGDSRAYRLHGGDLVQLTTDHSVAEELVARGELSEEEAAVHPHRHILTRALGVQPEVAVDVWQLVPEEGDRFLLCSDGADQRGARRRDRRRAVRDARSRGGGRDPGPPGQRGRRQRQRHRRRARRHGRESRSTAVPDGHPRRGSPPVPAPAVAGWRRRCRRGSRRRRARPWW